MIRALARPAGGMLLAAGMLAIAPRADGAVQAPRRPPAPANRGPAAPPDRERLAAALLAAEDARRWDSALVAEALRNADALIRSRAALAAGRIRGPGAQALVAPLLRDRAPAVQADAAFALGLLGDASGVGSLADRLAAQPAPDSATAAELVTGLAKLGGRQAAAAIAGVLDGSSKPADPTSSRGATAAALLESWRLEGDAPVAQIRRFTTASPELRWRAVYTLARLRARDGARELLAALADAEPLARAYAARALERPFVQQARLSRGEVAGRLLDAAGDPDPGVRVNALIALASFGDSMLVPALAPRLGDADPNVRQQAAATIGRLPGFAGLRALAAAVQDARQPWAVRHEALLGIARHDTTAFAAAGRSWRESADWRERAAAAEGWALAGHDLRGGPPAWLDDDEPRVVAWGLQAWLQAAPRTDSVLAAAARARLGAADAAVRSLAADALARSPDPADVPALAAMYQASGRDSFPQAALSALKALAAIARQSDSGRALVRRTFLQTVGDPAPGHADYLLREWAAHQWPELARRWGPPHPIATGHDDAFYLGVVRRYLLGAPNQRRPRVVIETEGAGPIELALLGPEAPLTVAHFLALVDAGFFNGHRWHRVVPNFVIQDGDPRGDGWGGPPGAIRDEINRVRYADPVLGMALDGPDTGNSQWFVNLSPQPHLDGTYTVFGRVVQGDAARSGRPSAAPAAALHRVTRGDRILRIRRVR